MNLVVGATGLLGSEVCRQLSASGQPVRALVRPTSYPAKKQALSALGAQLVEGDLKDPSSLKAACRGMTAVLSTASSTISRQAGDSIQSVDEQGQLQLVDAAEGAGVDRFVFVSFRPHPGLASPLDAAKRRVERRLEESGLAYTVLRAGSFMEIWLSPALGFDYANARVRIYGSGEQKLPWVFSGDVAQFAVACLSEPGSRRATFEVGGPEALGPLEVVRVFEELGGRRFQLEFVPEEVLRAQRDAASDPMQESFAALMLGYTRGDVIDMRETLRRFPALRLTSVRDYARRVLAAPSSSAERNLTGSRPSQRAQAFAASCASRSREIPR